jgi:hypothetical protein
MAKTGLGRNRVQPPVFRCGGASRSFCLCARGLAAKILRRGAEATLQSGNGRGGLVPIRPGHPRQSFARFRVNGGERQAAFERRLERLANSCLITLQPAAFARARQNAVNSCQSGRAGEWPGRSVSFPGRLGQRIARSGGVVAPCPGLWRGRLRIPVPLRGRIDPVGVGLLGQGELPIGVDALEGSVRPTQ